MRRASYWLAVGAILIVQVFINSPNVRDLTTRQWVLTGIVLLALIVLVMTEVRDKGDESDAAQVLNAGISTTAYQLQRLLLTPPQGRASKFETLYQTATNAISGLADPKHVQAQLFWVYRHEDHEHFVSIHASNGNLKQSDNHFSSVGDEIDRNVWTSAEEGVTVFYRNLSWHRLGRMPVGFKRGDKKRKYKTFITAPIKVEDKVLGLLTINSETPWSLSKRDKDLVEVFAQLLAVGASSTKPLRTPGDYATITSKARKGCRQ